MKSIITALLATWAIYSTDAVANIQQAEALYARRDYIAAAPSFFQAFSYAKSPAEKIRAALGLGKSLEKVQLDYSASKYLSLIVRKGPTVPYFTEALELLGNINERSSLGRSHVVQLFPNEVDPSSIPGRARGFYFYFKGIEAFDKKQYDPAASYLSQVSPGTVFFAKSRFHLGVIANLNGNGAKAKNFFEAAISSADGDNADWLKEQANLNIARALYEEKKFRESMRFYSEIPRSSDNWLQAIFESSWAFFILQKHNNTLGNIHTIHSPFFENRFFPESYILQAVTFLRLCEYKQVDKSLVAFRDRYSSVLKGLDKAIQEYQPEPAQFYSLVKKYRSGEKAQAEIGAILDSLSRLDVFRDAASTIRLSDSETAKLSRTPNNWQTSGLQDELKDFLDKKKLAASLDTGRRLLKMARSYSDYLKDLSAQTKFIKAEMNLGKIDKLREELNVTRAQDKNVNFIGGMKELNVGQDLEYWPFQGEYWEDELGGYVFNTSSKCSSSNRSESSENKK